MPPTGYVQALVDFFFQTGGTRTWGKRSLQKEMTLAITIDDEHVPGSPFTVDVHGGAADATAPRRSRAEVTEKTYLAPDVPRSPSPKPCSPRWRATSGGDWLRVGPGSVKGDGAAPSLTTAAETPSSSKAAARTTPQKVPRDERVRSVQSVWTSQLTVSVPRTPVPAVEA